MKLFGRKELEKMLSGFSPAVAEKLVQFIEKHHGKSLERKVAVFDADGTLWHSDLGEAFFRYQIERGLVPNGPENAWDVYFQESNFGDTAKAFGWLAQWNHGVRSADMTRWAEEFFQTRWKQNVFAPMRELCHALLNANFEIWVISGSIYWPIEVGVRGFGVPADRVLATNVHVVDGKLTDKVAGITPYRAGKQLLVEQVVGAKPLLAAGNTFWDKELVSTATEINLAISSEPAGDRNFESEQKLKAIAESNGWLVQVF